MTKEFRKKFNKEMNRLGILTTGDYPTGVVVSQAEDENGQLMTGYVQISGDDQVVSVLQEWDALLVASMSADAEDFWWTINALNGY